MAGYELIDDDTNLLILGKQMFILSKQERYNQCTLDGELFETNKCTEFLGFLNKFEIINGSCFTRHFELCMNSCSFR